MPRTDQQQRLLASLLPLLSHSTRLSPTSCAVGDARVAWRSSGDQGACPLVWRGIQRKHISFHVRLILTLRYLLSSLQVSFHC